MKLKLLLTTLVSLTVIVGCTNPELEAAKIKVSELRQELAKPVEVNYIEFDSYFEKKLAKLSGDKIDKVYAKRVFDALCETCEINTEKLIKSIEENGIYTTVGTFNSYIANDSDIDLIYMAVIRNEMLFSTDLGLEKLSSRVENLKDKKGSVYQRKEVLSEHMSEQEFATMEKEVLDKLNSILSYVGPIASDIYNDAVIAEPMLPAVIKYSDWISNCGPNSRGDWRKEASCEEDLREELKQKTSVNRKILEADIARLITIEKFVRKGSSDDELIEAFIKFREAATSYFNFMNQPSGNRFSAISQASELKTKLDERWSSLSIIFDIIEND